jgi:hypothetical protein
MIEEQLKGKIIKLNNIRGRTNRLDSTRTAKKTKKLGEDIQTQTAR